jgi:hypothetical protein
LFCYCVLDNNKNGVKSEVETVTSEEKQNMDSSENPCDETVTEFTAASCNGTSVLEANLSLVVDGSNSNGDSLQVREENNCDVDKLADAAEDCTTPVCTQPESDSGSVSSFKLLPCSPVSSPVHSVRTVVTSDDPLGLFCEPIAVLSKSTDVKPAGAAGSLQATKDRANSVAAIGLSGDVSALDKSLRKSSSLDRLLSAESSHRSSSMNDVEDDQASQEAVNKLAGLGHRPVSASPRMTASFGGTFRSAASLFATKYREIRQSVGPVRTASATNDSDAVDGSDQQNGCAASVEADQQNVPATADTVTSESVNVSAGSEVPGGVSSATSAVATKSRLKVSQTLYSPLGKYRARN